MINPTELLNNDPGHRLTQWLTDVYYCHFAKEVAINSPDPSTKVGAVLTTRTGELISVGYNDFVTKDCKQIEERFNRPLKYKWMVHAEIKALTNATTRGKYTYGSTLYLPFNSVPCTECCKVLISAGIDRIVCLGNYEFGGVGDHWKEDIEVARTMLKEAAVKIDVVYNEQWKLSYHHGFSGLDVRLV